MSRSVVDLKIGEVGVIKSLTNREISHKLLEMGCLPGNQIEILTYAPFKDPICVSIDGGYHLALRASEASTILIEG